MFFIPDIHINLFWLMIHLVSHASMQPAFYILLPFRLLLLRQPYNKPAAIPGAHCLLYLLGASYMFIGLSCFFTVWRLAPQLSFLPLVKRSVPSVTLPVKAGIYRHSHINSITNYGAATYLYPFFCQPLFKYPCPKIF